jgi:type VI secretion system protein ImpM
MPCGLFGKLPSKRDFVSYNMPRPFLDRWEHWLQEAVASSRLALGDQWQETYLTAPIWRFWFGPQVFGVGATGALMPSVDGVGRYFPLSVCYFVDGAHSRIVPPPNAGLDQWHQTCEQFLLGLLDDRLPDEPGALVQRVADAPVTTAITDDFATVQRGAVGQGPLDVAFASLVECNERALHSRRSYWWTAGGGQHAPRLLFNDDVTDTGCFKMMITGAFEHANAR